MQATMQSDTTNKASPLPYIITGGSLLLLAIIVFTVIIPRARDAGRSALMREYQHKANLGDPLSMSFVYGKKS